jgi:predicted metalloprotease
LGIDPRVLIGGAEMLGGSTHVQAPVSHAPRHTGTPNDSMGRFVSEVLGSTEVVWKDVFTREGGTYRPPVLVMYRNVTDAACGGRADHRMGPFYCPVDRKVYLDTSFFTEIERRFHGCSGKACSFSEAYVIAHEVGHHVQNLLGILPKVQKMQRAVSSKADANHLQVRVELQADCFAGVWAHNAGQKWNLLQPGYIEAALQTAAAIGDDTLQRRAQGYVVPDSFTHGSSAQRKRWFTTGFEQGKVGACNTFKAARL